MRQLLLCQINVIPLLSKPFVNEVTLRKQKWPLRCCQPLKFICFFKRFRSFDTASIKSVGQRATKLLFDKIWEWFDPGQSRTPAERACTHFGRKTNFFLRPRTLTASNFKALLSTDSLFTVSKDLNLLKKYTKYQKINDNFRLGFALSNGPHLHRAYLVTVRFDLILAVLYVACT